MRHYRMIAHVAALASAMTVTGHVCAQTAVGQDYPARPIRLLVPYAPGGVVDYVGRVTGLRVGESVGQTVVIDNRPGAGGILGVDIAAKAPADGYTLVIMDPAIVINPILQATVPYDPLKDLQTVSVLSSSPLVLAVHPALPVKDIGQLAAHARSNAGKLNFASAGVGTTPHMAGELFKQRIGAVLIHVPYKGSGPAMTDLVGGQVQMAFTSITAALPFIKDNRLRALATTGLKRSAALPDLPTVAEAGFAGFFVDLWLAVFAPAQTPAAAVARLNREFRKAIELPALRAEYAKVGVEPRGTSLEEGARFVRAEHEKWTKVVREANLKGAN